MVLPHLKRLQIYNDRTIANLDTKISRVERIEPQTAETGRERERLAALQQNFVGPGDVKLGASRRDDLQQALADVDDKIIVLGLELDNLKQQRDDIAQEDFDRKVEFETSRRDNQRAVKLYEEELKQASQGLFNPVQGVNESPEDYRQRLLDATKQVENPEFILRQYKTQQLALFRHNMLKLVPDTSVVEYAVNRLNSRDDTLIPLLNDKIGEVEREYRRTYGSGELNDVQFTSFLMKFVPEQEEEPLRTSAPAYGRPITSPRRLRAKRKPDPTTPLRKAVSTDVLVSQIIFLLEESGGEVRIGKKIYGVGTDRTTLVIDGKPQKELSNEDAVKIATKLRTLREGAPLANKIRGLQAAYEAPVVEGMGLKPKDMSLGILTVDGHKLYYDNVLSVRKGSNKIHGFRTVPISQQLTDVLLKLTSGKEPSQKDIATLGTEEQHLFHALMRAAKLHKEIVYHPETEVVDYLKKRLALVEAEIEAGNTNRANLSEVSDILNRLVAFRVITQTDKNAHFASVKRLF